MGAAVASGFCNQRQLPPLRNAVRLLRLGGPKQLEKEWRRFRKNESLDVLGHVNTDSVKYISRGATCMQSQRKTS